uniref:LisH domain-containing protein n=1 Tax=Heterorhabditis bacteriophora TaxID=37862 RepID=A0A1I7WN21_HETBA
MLEGALESNSGISANQSILGSRLHLLPLPTFESLKLMTWFVKYVIEPDRGGALMPSTSKSFHPMVLTYIEAVAEGVVIAATIEVCELFLRDSIAFKEYCEDLCHSIFQLAYSQIEITSMTNSEIETVNTYCSNLALDLLNAVYFNVLIHNLADISRDLPELNELSELHKSRSFANAFELEDIIERISPQTNHETELQECEFDASSSTLSSPIICYELLGEELIQNNSYSEFGTSSQNTSDTEQQFQEPIWYNEIEKSLETQYGIPTNLEYKDESVYYEQQYFKQLGSTNTHLSNTTNSNSSTTSSEDSIALPFHPILDESENSFDIYDDFTQQYIKALEYQQDIKQKTKQNITQDPRLITEGTPNANEYDNYNKRKLNNKNSQKFPIQKSKTTPSKQHHMYQNKKNNREDLTQDTTSSSVRDQTKDHLEIAKPSFSDDYEIESEHSSATSGADELASFDKGSFEVRAEYEGTSPLIGEEEPAILQKRDVPELTQEEMEHIAYIQRLAAESSFGRAVPPSDLPSSIAIEDVREQLDMTKPSFADDYDVESEHSSATSGADAIPSFDKGSFEVRAEYEGTSPLIGEEEPAILQKRDVPELTQEEMEHIAYIQRLAAENVREQLDMTKPSFADDYEVECNNSLGGGVIHFSSHVENPNEVINVSSNFNSESSRDLRSSISFSADDSPRFISTFVKSVDDACIRNDALRRGTSVHVVYTDHSLQASQSSRQDGGSEILDNHYVLDSFESSHRENTSLRWADIGAINTEIITPGTSPTRLLRRSLSDIIQDTFDSIRPDILRSSRSTSCVDNVCDQLHSRLNAYELCEQHSFTESKDLLCNVDFLCRLNFAAHRMTEDIAEVAGKELRVYYRSQLNPRARYFSDAVAINRSISVSSLEEDVTVRTKNDFTVEPALSEVPSFGLFSFLTPKKSSLIDRPRSPLAMFSGSSGESRSSRKASEDRSGDILVLLRRSSGADSRASMESPIRLPDNALVGLSDTEKEHIFNVLNKSTRSVSPNISRRNSSALQLLPEMENLSELEKEHIQNVLEKAEQKTPYMVRMPLRHQLTARTESFQSQNTDPVSVVLSHTSQEDDYDTQIQSIEDAIRKVEQNSTKNTTRTNIEESSILEVDHPSLEYNFPSKLSDIAEKISMTMTSVNHMDRDKMNLKSEKKIILPPIAISHPTPPQSAKIESSRKSSDSGSSFVFSATPIGGFKSLFGKATQSVIQATENLVKDVTMARDVSRTQDESKRQELDRIKHITQEVDFCRKYEDSAPITLPEKTLNNQTEKPSQLTLEEIEHIRNIASLADLDVGLTVLRNKSNLVMNNDIAETAKGIIDKEETELTESEFSMRDQGRMEYNSTGHVKLYAEPFSHMPLKIEERGSTDVSTEAITQILPEIENLKTNFIESEFNAIEAPNSNEITSIAISEKNIQMSSFPTKKPITVLNEPAISQEELEHIRRITEAAEKELQSSYVPIHENLPSLSLKFKDFTDFSIKSIKSVISKAEETSNVLPRNLVDLKMSPIPLDKHLNAAALSANSTWENTNDIHSLPDIHDFEQEDRSLSENEMKTEENEELQEETVEEDSWTEQHSRRSCSQQSLSSRKSSDFDIRSVHEMRHDMNLGLWYEEQLLFMKESIADSKDEISNTGG